MEWIAKLEECSIELLYVAHDCGNQKLAEQLRLIAAYLDGLAKEARQASLEMRGRSEGLCAIRAVGTVLQISSVVLTLEAGPIALTT